MLVIFLLLGLLIPNPESQGADLCSPLNHCQIERTAWEKKEWKVLKKAELDFDSFCAPNRPQLDLDKSYGIELWLFSGQKEGGPVEATPRVNVNLYKNKLTYVVASADAPVDAPFVSFTHRPTPKSKELLKVSCWKK